LVQGQKRAEQLPDLLPWLGADTPQLQVELAAKFASFQAGYRFGISHGYTF